MRKELKKRILTSAVLILLISLCVYLGPLVTILSLFVVSYIAYSEFSYLIDKIYSYSHIKHFLRRGLILFYCFFIFWIATFILITNIYDFIFVLAICIFTDVGGYIVGKSIKGPKLTKISPNKTISGSIGSVLFSFIPLIILSYFLPENYSLSNSNIIFCLEITIICQLGDLFFSFLKRKAKD